MTQFEKSKRAEARKWLRTMDDTAPLPRGIRAAVVSLLFAWPFINPEADGPLTFG